ncbi:DUF2239 domain-containing protein [Caulobacter sp. CCUG 60055]|uniref:DUF2239 family protein n=1 Tax=Caulobacter sp. CCUG 60055 TaxID=2100090 RepID=UPI001FA71DB2|nr:DUF2239 family protein [Caulobacter sp. CCUG 60055]MBQ1543159.1 DUF2239 family protein [Caulobacteraceae bacterium]MCI3179941.1 DUF2239 domain-containing protein [Caulobacter sp. CCUG 60055]
MTDPSRPCVAYCGARRIAAGGMAEVAQAARRALAETGDPVLMFDAVTGEQLDVETQPDAAVPPPARGRGRPRLGVAAREVTLLPRHWDWLAAQPGGASAALRRLVEAASRVDDPRTRLRRTQEAAYRFMTVMAGNLEGFEEALRALYAGDRAAFLERSDGWPTDIRDQARAMADHAFAPSPSTRALGGEAGGDEAGPA